MVSSEGRGRWHVLGGTPAVGVLMGCIVVICVGYGCGCESGQVRSPHEMSSEMRQEADDMILKYQAGKLHSTLRVPILGTPRDVGIVESWRGAKYGFLEVPNSGTVYAHEYNKYTIYSYTQSYLLVIVKEPYAGKLPEISQ